MHSRHSKYVIILAVGSGLFLTLLDQITKYMATRWLNHFEPVQIISDFLYLTLVHNKGAAFGFLSSIPDPWRVIIFTLISILAMSVLIVMFRSRPEKDRIISVSITFIAGGALGNFIDRIRFGYVVDFIDTYPFGYHFPTFNIADSCITIGVTLMMIHLLFFENRGR